MCFHENPIFFLILKQEKPSANVSAKLPAPEKMDVSELKPEIGKQETPSVVEKQKAIVKPHILTHVIEGFVIQEGPEPFPVSRVKWSELVSSYPY